MNRRGSRWRGPFVLLAALPMLGGAGTCGILFDLWSWDEITDAADRAHVDVEEGAVEIVGYVRTNVWIQRHVYAFEKRIGTAEYGVEDRVFEVTFSCTDRGDAVCFADHWLEVPQAMPITVLLGKGPLSLNSLAGPLDLTVDEGSVDGDALLAPTLVLEGDALDHVALTWAMAPESVAIDIAAGDVDLRVPAGDYACDFAGDGGTDVDPAIVCMDGADASIHVDAGRGSLKVSPSP
jgi:hypothetical protein